MTPEYTEAEKAYFRAVNGGPPMTEKEAETFITEFCRKDEYGMYVNAPEYTPLTSLDFWIGKLRYYKALHSE